MSGHPCVHSLLLRSSKQEEGRDSRSPGLRQVGEPGVARSDGSREPRIHLHFVGILCTFNLVQEPQLSTSPCAFLYISHSPPALHTCSICDTFLLALHFGQLIPIAVVKYVKLPLLAAILNHSHCVLDLPKKQADRGRNANEGTRTANTSSTAHSRDDERSEPQKTVESVKNEIRFQARPPHEPLLVRCKVLIQQEERGLDRVD